MRICAEIKCYHCGYVSGQICGESDGPLRWDELRPNPNHTGSLPQPGAPLRCFRCHGPVYLDEIEKQRVTRPIHADKELVGRGGRRKRQGAA